MSRAGARKIEKLTDERRVFVEDNLNLVDYIIQRQLHIPVYDMYYEDYQQEGRVGLIMAAIRYDESKGFAFSTFAAQYIIGMVKRFRRDFVRGEVKISRKVVDLIPRVTNLYLEGYSYEEISDKLNLSSDEYQAVLCALSITSLDSPIGYDSNGNSLYVSDTVGHEDWNLVDVMGEERVIECIERTADVFTKDYHRDIWYDYIYPAFFGERVVNTVIAKKYNCSQAQVNRILNKGKKRLKEIFEEK